MRLALDLCSLSGWQGVAITNEVKVYRLGNTANFISSSLYGA